MERLRQRPLHPRYPYRWLDALYLKVRPNHRIVSQAVVIAVGVRETNKAVVAALVHTIFAQPDRSAARLHLRER